MFMLLACYSAGPWHGFGCNALPAATRVSALRLQRIMDAESSAKAKYSADQSGSNESTRYRPCVVGEMTRRAITRSSAAKVPYPTTVIAWMDRCRAYNTPFAISLRHRWRDGIWPRGSFGSEADISIDMCGPQ